MAISILFAVLGFGFLIVIHEAGHFLIARAFKIEADEFSIGMGPKLVSKPWGRTLFSLRAFPIGAFVMFADPGEGDTETAEGIHTENPYLNSPAWKRFFISLAGPFFNFFLATLVLITLAFFTGIPSNTPLIGGVMPDGVAEEAGIEIGDIIVSINGNEISYWSDITEHVAPASGREITVVVERDGNLLSFTMIPQENAEGRGVIGVGGRVQQFMLFGSVLEGFRQTWTFISETVKGFASLFQKDALDSFIGPIGIVSVTGQVAQTGFANFVWFLAYLSINLGVVNLLPIPALDGGRVVFLLLEMIRGKKMNEKLESTISSIGFALIFGLILLVSMRDIFQLR